jgi:hypothetical protein
MKSSAELVLDGIPKVGLFWWKPVKDNNTEGKKKYELIFPETFNIGDTMLVDHHTVWEREKTFGKISGDYRDIPRGRVQWNPGLCQIEIFTGEYNPPEGLKLLIINKFNLWNVIIDWKYNAHYDMENMADSIFGNGEFD